MTKKAVKKIYKQPAVIKHGKLSTVILGSGTSQADLGSNSNTGLDIG